MRAKKQEQQQQMRAINKMNAEKVIKGFNWKIEVVMLKKVKQTKGLTDK